MKDHFRLAIFIIILGVISIPIKHYFFPGNRDYICNTGNIKIQINTPDCVKMYSSIKKHSRDYNIPQRYAFGIAYKETRYDGPLNWFYDGAQGSSAGALGPMQIMPSTANGVWGKKISTERLRNDIDFNVETSMKILRKLHDKYEDWKVVFGCYNTGRPCINEYAKDVYNF